ncbi:glycine cleavage system protein H [Pelomonas sp. V22]|uniref:glycine cleavage system protein H n=1 Tax=Pelomonas sp. V22 TaxID=2822139 RepID=UPI0024A8F561|nr:glycine cleavage system protein H [Pelomonas sp. V22]MDI4632175.1 glycine cleavage system protein H [Pelomonas sp. V22]
MLIAGTELPEDLLYLVDEQTWARLLPDGSARLGITALGLKASGEIYMCRPKPVGEQIAQGRSMAVVELAKSIVSVKSPLSGEVLEINAQLAERPELILADCYGEGWLLRLGPHSLDTERHQLLQGEAARAAMEHYAWLNQLQ